MAIDKNKFGEVKPGEKPCVKGMNILETGNLEVAKANEVLQFALKEGINLYEMSDKLFLNISTNNGKSKEVDEQK